MVRTGAGVTLVRATLADGSTDEMAAVDGIAVLATGTGWLPDGRIEAFDATGAPRSVG